MKQTEKKSSRFSFMYIDIFFLLVAGFILSLGIGFLAETHYENRSRTYQVHLSAVVEETFAHAIPAAGDPVFGENGESVGKVLAVVTEEAQGHLILKMKCRLEGEEPLPGEEFLLETPGSIRRMRIDSAEPEFSKKKGR